MKGEEKIPLSVDRKRIDRSKMTKGQIELLDSFNEEFKTRTNCNPTLAIEKMHFLRIIENSYIGESSEEEEEDERLSSEDNEIHTNSKDVED